MAAQARNSSQRHAYYYSGSIGFSGVATALCAIAGFKRAGRVTVLGLFEIPSELLCWWQIFSSQLLTPRSSFLGEGHLPSTHPPQATTACSLHHLHRHP